jgi:hypothetical protein
MNTQDKIIQNKLGVLKLAKMLGNVSQACKVMGVSRDSFYRFKRSAELTSKPTLRYRRRNRTSRDQPQEALYGVWVAKLTQGAK